MRCSSRFVRPIPALQIVLANCILCFGQGAFAESEPPVEGDPSLFDLVRSAQAANIERLTEGRLVARRTVELSQGKSVYDVSVTWKGEKAYWNYSEDHRDYPPASDDPAYLKRHAQFEAMATPLRRRLVFDGKQYSLLHVGEPQSALILPTEGSRAIRNLKDVDLRPQTAWTGLRVRPFVELIGPHPNMPDDGIAKWVVDATPSGEVRIERHDSNGALSVLVADLNLAGNIVKTSYDSERQATKSSFQWIKDEQGRVLLQGSDYEISDNLGRNRYKLDVLSIDLDTPVSDDLFTLETLRIKPGTPVDDRVKGRRYTYKGREVTQQMLEEMIRKTKSQGFAAP